MNNEQEYYSPEERNFIAETAMRFIASKLSASDFSIHDIGESYIKEAFEKAKLFVKVRREVL